MVTSGYYSYCFLGFAVAMVLEDKGTNVLVLSGETNVIKGSTNKESESETYFKVR